MLGTGRDLSVRRDRNNLSVSIRLSLNEIKGKLFYVKTARRYNRCFCANWNLEFVFWNLITTLLQFSQSTCEILENHVLRRVGQR